MVSKLLTRIRTVDERDKLLSEVDLLLASTYEDQGKGFEKALSGRVRFWVSEIVKEEVVREKDNVGKYLGDLKREIDLIKVISLKLAFEPTEVSIDKIYDFIKKNVQENVVLSFEYDPRLLGGIEINWKGEYRDFSLRRLFEEEYEAKRGEVVKIMYSK